MHLWSILVVAVLAADEPSGRIAWLAGAHPDERCVCVRDVAADETVRLAEGRQPGPPVWSPDGAWLAFTVTGEAGMTMAVARPDGSDPRVLESDATWLAAAAWSHLPEEQSAPYRPRLAYSAGVGSPDQATIRVCDLETGEEQVWGGGQRGLLRPVWLGELRLVALLREQLRLQTGPEAELWTSITPDPANTILAIGLRPTEGRLTTDIFVVTPDHALPLPAFVMPSEGAYEEWAVELNPRRVKEIAFESNDGGDREIFVLSRKGAVPVTNHRAADWNPVWSPDGDWLAFESFRSGRRGVYRVSPESVLVFPVTATDTADYWSPAWSPDGEWLAMVTDATGAPEVMLTRIDGSGVRPWTDDGRTNLAPAWAPRRPE